MEPAWDVASGLEGAVALMLALRPDLKPNEVREILIKSARPFVTGTGRDCTPALCGAGVMVVDTALRAAARATPPLSSSAATFF